MGDSAPYRTLARELAGRPGRLTARRVVARAEKARQPFLPGLPENHPWATEAIIKANEPLTNSRQQSHIIVSSRFFLTAAGAIRFMLHLAVILCLDKIGIILIYL